MYVDNDFEPDDNSIGMGVLSMLGNRPIVWLRPSEIAGTLNPVLFTDGVSPADVQQGILGDCFLVTALALIASQMMLLKSVIRPSKGGDGRYSVFVWECGLKCTLTVDDLIPCCSFTRQPIFARCRDRNQFWVQLVEKALAKRAGSYSALAGGHIGEILYDLTGGAPSPSALI